MSSRDINFEELVLVTQRVFLESFHVDALVISLGGSYSLELSNGTSDIDLYLIYSRRSTKNTMNIPRKVSISCNSLHGKTDVMCVELKDILEQIKIYKATSLIYPTYTHRSSGEQEKNKNIMDISRDDFVRGMVFRTILTEKVWVNGEIKEYFSLFRQGLECIDVVDFYFTRAKGNYANSIVGKKEVLCRKYLYTLHEIFYCFWIIDLGTIPPLSFFQLRTICLTAYVQQEIDKLLEQNSLSNSKKEDLAVGTSKILNEFIYTGLDRIENGISSLKGKFFVS